MSEAGRGHTVTKERAAQIAKLWPDHDLKEIGHELGLSQGTVNKWAKEIHKISEGRFCSPKPSKKRTMKGTIVEMLAELAEQ